MSSPPLFHGLHRQGSTKRFRNSSSWDLLDPFLAFWKQAGSLPPSSLDLVNGSIKTEITRKHYTPILNASIDCLVTECPRLHQSFSQHSSAPVWRRKRLHATVMASPTCRHWLPHAPFSWKSSVSPCASRDGSAVNFAAFSPFSPRCTEYRRGGPLPWSAGLNSQMP